MGRHGIVTLILAADVVAVVDDSLRAVYEVTRCFPFHRATFIFITSLADGTIIQVCQGNMIQTRRRSLLMFVLGIYEATTDTRLHIDEVEFDDAGNVTPVFLVQFLTRALLRSQLQIDA